MNTFLIPFFLILGMTLISLLCKNIHVAVQCVFSLMVIVFFGGFLWLCIDSVIEPTYESSIALSIYFLILLFPLYWLSKDNKLDMISQVDIKKLENLINFVIIFLFPVFLYYLNNITNAFMADISTLRNATLRVEYVDNRTIIDRIIVYREI